MKIQFHHILFISLLTAITFNLTAQKNYLEKSESFSNTDSSLKYLSLYLKSPGASTKEELLNAYLRLSRMYLDKSNFAGAAKTLDEAINKTEFESDNITKIKLFREYGNVFKAEGKYGLSLEYYLKARRLLKTVNNNSLFFQNNIDLAEYYRSIGKHDKAKKYIKLSFTGFQTKKINDTSLLIYAYNRAAAIENESNPDISVSIAYSKKALVLAQKSKNINAQAVSWNELGYTYKNLKKNDSSEFCYLKAEELWNSVGDNTASVHAMSNRAMLYAHNDYPKQKTRELYREIIDVVTLKKIAYSLKDVYYHLYTSYIYDGDTTNAFNYFYNYHHAYIEYEKKIHSAEITNISEKYENENLIQQNENISEELNSSRMETDLKHQQNRILIISLIIIVTALCFIVYLIYRIHKANKELKLKNQQKDLLIREIHHRVKNNLQFINSLVNMQINSSADNVEKESLLDASRRIKAMGLVHEMLYNHSEVEGVDIKAYLLELVASLKDMISSDSLPIEFKTDISSMTMNISDTVSLGMITSELISNSIKHAFHQTDHPCISVSLYKNENDEIVFSIKDNGIGLITDHHNKKTLGMRLIDIFSRQLNGKYEIWGENGFGYKLTLTN